MWRFLTLAPSPKPSNPPAGLDGSWASVTRPHHLLWHILHYFEQFVLKKKVSIHYRAYKHAMFGSLHRILSFFLIHGWIKSLGLLGRAYNHHMPVHIPLAAVPVVLIKLLNVYKYRLHTVSAVKPAVCLETSHYTCAFSHCEPEKGRLTVCQVIDKKCQDLTTTNFF